MKNYKASFLPHNAIGDCADLQMRVRWENGSMSVNLGHKITISKWNMDVQMCVSNSTHGPKKESASCINKVIKDYRRIVDEVACEFAPSYEPTSAEFKESFRYAIGKAPHSDKTDSNKVSRVMTDYILRQSQHKSWSKNTIKKQRSLRTIISEWKADAVLSDFDSSGLDSFHSHLLNSKGLKNTTIEKYLIDLKTFLRWCGTKAGGYNVPDDYKEYSPQIKTTHKTIVWLYWDELLRLYSADLSGMNKRCDNHTEEVRDMFCFSCFTGLRYSDIVSLRHSDILADKIAPIPLNKTTETVTIELNQYSRAILAKYKDYDVVSALPQVSNVKCNKIIKDICEYLGFNRSVTETFYKGGERLQDTKPLHKFITMHTGRRTFICSALEKGISPLVVMQWTGHQDYEEMKPYIDISDKAKASAMKLFDA